MLLENLAQHLSEFIKSYICDDSSVLNKLKEAFNEREELRLSAVLALNDVRGAKALAEDILNKERLSTAGICLEHIDNPHLFYSLLGFLIKRTK
jgi:hypothetical protein